MECIDASYKKSQYFKKIPFMDVHANDPVIADTSTHPLVRILGELNSHQSAH